MPDYKVGYDADTKTASVVMLPDTIPVGDTDLGSFEHAPADPDVLYHHVQDKLYALGEYNMQSVSIVKHGPIINATSISIAEVSVAVAATEALVIKWQPADSAADNDDFTYVSADPAVATVSAAGVVTGVAEGETTITVSHADTGLSGEVAVTVTAA